MAADHASHAAAVAAGFKSTATDRGAAFAPSSQRWHVRLSKPTVGQTGASGKEIRADGFGSSQANAESAAVTALNGQRALRYGRGGANTGSGTAGGTLTDDLS